MASHLIEIFLGTQYSFYNSLLWIEVLLIFMFNAIFDKVCEQSMIYYPLLLTAAIASTHKCLSTRYQWQSYIGRIRKIFQFLYSVKSSLINTWTVQFSIEPRKKPTLCPLAHAYVNFLCITNEVIKSFFNNFDISMKYIKEIYIYIYI
jgi:hypothetical protein